MPHLSFRLLGSLLHPMALRQVALVVWLGGFSLCGALFTPVPANAQALEADPTVYGASSQPAPTVPPAKLSSREPIKLRVTESRQLPADMYGQWSVIATLVKTDLPGSHQSRVYDIWQLSESGGQVSLSNPNTGAFASITVDNVEGNTATFNHKVVMQSGKRFLIERPTVTVTDDRMVGTTTHTYVTLNRQGQVVQVQTALFRIDASRLTHSRTEFGDSNRQPDIEIEDVQSGSAALYKNPETVESVMFQP